MRIIKFFSIVAIGLFMTSNALAYGTVHILGQNAEHERMTRRALACGIETSVDDCFEEDTLDKLAGKRATFGGVGFPDIPTKKMVNQASAHCDGGDFLDVPDYGRDKQGHNRTLEEANAAIMECRDWMNENFAAALKTAADLLDDNGALLADQVKISGNCIKNPKKKNSAKCKTLTHLGIVLHAVQDFYSHSNWTDIADAGAPMAPENAPGMGEDTPAPYFQMPSVDQPFPAGLITGCYEGLMEKRHCRYKDQAGTRHNRVKHMHLNKDKGVVDPASDDESATDYGDVGRLGPGKAGRGAVNHNFERSVRAAILDTRAKLSEFKAALTAEHGEEQAALIICALTKDAPLADCAN